MIAAPVGEYSVAIESPGFERTTAKAVAAEKAAVVRIALEPLAQLTGRVVARGSNEPLGGAIVRAGDAEPVSPIAADGCRSTRAAMPGLRMSP